MYVCIFNSLALYVYEVLTKLSLGILGNCCIMDSIGCWELVQLLDSVLHW